MQAWHIWLVLAIFFAIVEIFTPGFVILCFSGGGLVASGLALFGLSLSWQILGFAAGTFLAFISIRPLFQKWAQKHEKVAATNVDRLVGQKATVVETVTEDRGRVKIGGEEWSARPADAASYARGEKVQVVKVEGNKVLVTRPGASV